MERISAILAQVCPAATPEIRSKMREAMEAAAGMSIDERERQREAQYNSSAGRLHTSDGYDCPVCMNRGDTMRTYQAENGTWYENLIPCACMEARRSIARIHQSGLTDAMKRLTFERYEAKTPWQERIKAQAMRYTGDENEAWFYIGGAIGAGKTHICTAMAVKLIERAPLLYVLWQDESVRLKSLVMDNKAYEQRMYRLKNIDILYIDDFFKAVRDSKGEVLPPTAADVRLAHELINSRYASNRRTIISSERHLSEIVEIDQALGGRIAEKAVDYTLNIARAQGRDYREKIAGKAL